VRAGIESGPVPPNEGFRLSTRNDVYDLGTNSVTWAKWLNCPYFERRIIKQMDDILKELAIKQGYVPEGCTFDGQMIMHLTQMDGDACKGCNEDRKICGGRERSKEIN